MVTNKKASVPEEQPSRQTMIEHNPTYQMMTGTKHQLNSIMEYLDTLSCADAAEAAIKIRHAMVDLEDAQNFLAAHVDKILPTPELKETNNG